MNNDTKFKNTFKPCHLGFHWIALAEYSQMSTFSTHMPGFQSFFRFLHHFLLAKLATSSISVNDSYIRPSFRSDPCGRHKLTSGQCTRLVMRENDDLGLVVMKREIAPVPGFLYSPYVS